MNLSFKSQGILHIYTNKLNLPVVFIHVMFALFQGLQRLIEATTKF